MTRPNTTLTEPATPSPLDVRTSATPLRIEDVAAIPNQRVVQHEYPR